jgi:CheY-like chemotaxis protein
MSRSPIDVPKLTSRALVVCDDRLIAAVVGQLLVALDYAPISVGTGTEAVRTLTTRTFDLIVAKYEGRPIDGLALYDFLQESKAYRLIPFVLMVKSDMRARLTVNRSQLPVMIAPPFGQIALQRAIARAKDPSLPDEGDIFEI